MKSVLFLAGSAAFACASITYANEGFDKLEVFRSLELDEGNWHTVITVQEASLEELAQSDAVTAQLREQMVGMSGKTYENDDCIGNALAANGNLVLPGLEVQSTCVIEQSSVVGRSFDLTFSCGVNKGLTARYKGVAAAGKIDATLETTMSSPKVTTHVKMRIRGERTAACQPR